jgi:hypothetical protein
MLNLLKNQYLIDMNPSLSKVIKNYSDLLKSPPHTDKDLKTFTKKVAALAHLLAGPLSNLVLEELKDTGFKAKYAQLIAIADQKMEEDYYCHISDQGLLIITDPQNLETSHSPYSPQKLAEILLVDSPVNPEQQRLVELFLSNETLFVVFNFALHLRS